MPLNVQRTRGFSMLEVLVALAVLSVGLLGAAAMLLDSLRAQASAMHRLGATQLARDMADRIRANPHGREFYDTRTSLPLAEACESSGCDAAQRAVADRAHWDAAGRAFLGRDIAARITFEPAIGPATPDRYVISLHWREFRDAADDNDVALQVLAQSPVAG